MTPKDVLRDVCEELGIDAREARGWLEYMFTFGQFDEAHYDDCLNGLKTGKTKFSKFVKSAVKHGLLNQYVILTPAVDIESDEEVVRDFVTVTEDSEHRRARAKEEGDWELKARDLRFQFWYPSLVDDLVDLVISENKGKEKTWRSIINEVYTPILDLQHEGISGDIIQFALNETIRRNIPNAMYAKKIAKSEAKKRAEENTTMFANKDCFHLPDGTICGQYDTWALDDPRYRELYISAFGDPDAV